MPLNQPMSAALGFTLTKRVANPMYAPPSYTAPLSQMDSPTTRQFYPRQWGRVIAPSFPNSTVDGPATGVGEAYNVGSVLRDGRIVMGGDMSYLRVYDPYTNTMSDPIGNLTTPRIRGGAALLPNGTVHFLSAFNAAGIIYDPFTNTARTTRGTNGVADLCGCVLLANGLVYCPPTITTTARLYDYLTDTYSIAGGTFTGTYSGCCLLRDGRVFIVPNGASVARIYDPVTDTLSTPSGTYTGNAARGGCIMNDGRVFLRPRDNQFIYDPFTDTQVAMGGTWNSTGSNRMATLLPNGSVFAYSGNATFYRVYDPTTDTAFQPTGSFVTSNVGFLLPDGRLFVISGSASSYHKIYGSANIPLTTLYRTGSLTNYAGV